MSKLSRKAILAVLSLVLTFVALGATTFAWFSLGTTATVEQFNVNVKGSEGLEISFGDSGEWYTRINTSNMNEYINVAFPNLKLDAVTTKDGINFYKMDNVGSDGSIVTTLITTGEGANFDGEFLYFDLHFRTKVPNQKLVLDGMTFDSATFDWEIDIPFTPEDGEGKTLSETIPITPHFAARVSLQGKDESALTFQAPEIEDDLNLGYVLTKGGHNYVARKNGLDALLAPTDADFSDYVDAALQEYNEDIVVFDTDINDDGYYTTTVTVKVWIEGWDANTYDSIFNKELQFSFGFKIEENQ